MPGEEKPNDLVRVARPSAQALQTILLAAILGGGTFGGLTGNSKLDAGLEAQKKLAGDVEKLTGDVQKLTGSLTELRTRVEASEKLAIDTRLRALEQLGAERRLEELERERGRK